MATKVKPCRIKATGTPQVGYVPKYVDEDTFQWGAGGGGGGSDIEYVTQAEYNALLPGAASDGKHYFIYSTSGGGGWQPGVNTIAYYPFTSTTTLNDMSGNSRNLTGEGTYSFVTEGSVECAYINGGQLQSNVSFNPSNGITVSAWYKRNTRPINDNGTIVRVGANSATGLNLVDNPGGFYSGAPGITSATDYRSSEYLTYTMDNTALGNWNYVVETYSGGKINLYVNGILRGSYTPNGGFNTTHAELAISRWSSNFDRSIRGYVSNVILEDKSWTAEEVADYYDLTKSNYGIS